jgi:hypothetical protein
MTIKAWEFTMRVETIEEGRVRVTLTDEGAHLASFDIAAELTTEARKKALRLASDFINWLYGDKEY